MANPSKVLSVQNVHCETLGEMEGMLNSDGFEIEHVNAQSHDLPKTLSGYSAMILLGGPMAVYDNLDYIDREIDLVRSGLKNNIPVLGICLGSQIIASAAGGLVFKGQKKEIGWHHVLLHDGAGNGGGIFDGVVSPDGKPLQVFQWHGDTYRLPKEARILAHSDLYPQSFQVGSAIGIQFHLEVNKRMVEDWINEYRMELESENILPGHLLSGREDDFGRLTAVCRKVYSNFARMVIAKSNMQA